MGLGRELSPGFNEECGVFAICNHPEASRMTYLGLYALQHRGQEASGISTLDGGRHHTYRGRGLVADVFQEKTLNDLPGRWAIGHNRYSTTGGNEIHNIQPLRAQLFNGPVSIAHNGNLVEASKVRDKLKKKGAIFQGTGDTEIILHSIAHNLKQDLAFCLKEVLESLDGAYSLVVLTPKGVIAARDPRGFRPLVLGEIPLEGGGKAQALSSETCAFDLIGASFVREIEPGEIYCLGEDGKEHSLFLDKSLPKSQCIFEHVYFSRPDSIVFGQSVYQTRKRLGLLLARHFPCEPADLVIPVPDSGVAAALGYAQESGLPFELGIIRNHYVGRTFIEPKQSIRSFGVRVKLNPQEAVLRGKNVVIVDDSLVRGTTSRKLVQFVRHFGARRVHMRIASPPIVAPCYYGVDTPSRDQLIAGSKSLGEIRDYIGADSLQYLPTEFLLEAVESELGKTMGNSELAIPSNPGATQRGPWEAGGGSMELKAKNLSQGSSTKRSEYCTACFTDRYPTVTPI